MFYSHKYIILIILVLFVSGCSNDAPYVEDNANATKDAHASDHTHETGEPHSHEEDTKMENDHNDSHSSMTGSEVHKEDTVHPHTHSHSEEQFLKEMIPHHQEAVDTSELIVKSTKDDTLSALTQHIIISQAAEIKMMEEWLEEWYPDSEYVVSYHLMMRPLEGLEGKELDLIYMEDMIHHHEMAVDMARELLSLNASSLHSETRILAQSILTVQEREVRLMRNIIASYENNTTLVVNIDEHTH